jgi:phosphatidate cytidylyltransferase
MTVDAAEAVTVALGRAGTGALKRVATAVVAVPVFAWLVARAPEWVFVLFVVAVSGAGAWELARLLERAGARVYGRFAAVAAVVVTASFAIPAHAIVPGFPSLVVTLAIAAALSAPVWLGGHPTIAPVAYTLFAVLYVGWFLGHAIALRHLVAGAGLVLFLAGVTWIGESAAYVVGSTLGRHKLAPAISPNKTIEGAVAQLVASLLSGLALAAWLLPEWSAVRALGGSAVLGLVGQVGDLAESAMKRSAGVKDTGGLVPGHGGLLDRMDSLLFNTPALYYYLALGGGA